MLNVSGVRSGHFWRLDSRKAKRKREHKLGIRASSTCELIFDGCRIPGDRVLGEIGKECVFIVTGKDSDLKSDSDLQQPGKGRLIAVQSPNSGVAGTWEYMTRLEPAFKTLAPAP